MYKKCAMLFFLYNLVFILAVLCVQGISINKKVAEAFTISQERETLIRMTSYGGRSNHQSSAQRVLEANTITKDRNLLITQSEYENLLRIGRFYTVKISEETIEAVNRVLQGEDNSQGALYFAAREIANQEHMKWFDDKLQRLFVHGGHEFFSN